MVRVSASNISFNFTPLFIHFIPAGNIETQKGKSMVMKNLYGNAHAFIIMYDVTNIQSYNDVYEW